jgi:hypothetical protein
MEGVRANEKYEVMVGEPEPPEQLKDLDIAIAAWKRFIASESQVLLEGVKPGADIMATEKMQKFMTEQGRVSSGLSEQSGTILKAVEDLKAGIGEVRANREVAEKLEKFEKSLGVLEKVQKGIDQILSMPIPGNTPLRLVVPGALSKSDSPRAMQVDALKAAAVGAPQSVREYLLHEASAIERTYPNG